MAHNFVERYRRNSNALLAQSRSSVNLQPGPIYFSTVPITWKVWAEVMGAHSLPREISDTYPQ